LLILKKPFAIVGGFFICRYFDVKKIKKHFTKTFEINTFAPQLKQTATLTKF